MDNIFTERFWRSLKYENIYIKNYRTYDEAIAGIAEYMEFFNTERPHDSLDDLTPADVHFPLPEQTKKEYLLFTDVGIAKAKPAHHILTPYLV